MKEIGRGYEKSKQGNKAQRKGRHTCTKEKWRQCVCSCFIIKLDYEI